MNETDNAREKRRLYMRNYMHKYREDIRNDTAAYNNYKLSRKENYQKLKEKKKVLPISEMSPKSQKKLRQKWKVNSKNYYKRKTSALNDVKNNENVALVADKNVLCGQKRRKKHVNLASERQKTKKFLLKMDDELRGEKRKFEPEISIHVIKEEAEDEEQEGEIQDEEDEEDQIIQHEKRLKSMQYVVYEAPQNEEQWSNPVKQEIDEEEEEEGYEEEEEEETVQDEEDKIIQHGKTSKGLDYSVYEVPRIKNVQVKKLLPACQCSKKCYTKISETEREMIHYNYYNGLRTNNEKRLFVASRCHCDTRIKFANCQKRQYITYDFEINGKIIPVCRTFFLNTLNISAQSVKTALEKKGIGGTILPDMRGHKEPPNKTPVEIIDKIRRHIENFLTATGYYNTDKASRKDLKLSIRKMHSLLVAAEKKAGTPEDKIPKLWLYHKIFNEDYNLAR